MGTIERYLDLKQMGDKWFAVYEVVDTETGLISVRCVEARRCDNLKSGIKPDEVAKPVDDWFDHYVKFVDDDMQAKMDEYKKKAGGFDPDAGKIYCSVKL